MTAPKAFDQNDQAYLIDDNLQAAVDIALKLGMPLLVTGEPGTGKTQLASHVAKEMNAQLLRFNTKTGSKAKDLLYKYNAITHFRDSQTGNKALNPMNYIRFTGLGKAILDSEKIRSVVLIDEIDKAPRDFPNDVLFEFEELAFEVDEVAPAELKNWMKNQLLGIQVDDQGYIRFKGPKEKRPILILTSNSEKNLPDAFLRRCAYYHIPFPDAEQLKKIVKKNKPLSQTFTQKQLDDAVGHFLKVRGLSLKKRPATAELLSWIDYLVDEGIDVKRGLDGSSDEIKRKLHQSYTLLGKNLEDRNRMLSELKK